MTARATMQARHDREAIRDRAAELLRGTSLSPPERAAVRAALAAAEAALAEGTGDQPPSSSPSSSTA
jgi:hypothetical protein